MGRLRILTQEAGDGVLTVGASPLTIGRRPDNDLCVPHDSISSRHGELREEGGRLLVRDLGSTNGTHFQDEPVTEAMIEPGQTFRLGSVEVMYEADEADEAEPAAPQAMPPSPPSFAPAALGALVSPRPAAVATPGAGACKKHAEQPLTLICPKCRVKYCEQCVSHHEIAGKVKRYCPACKSTCQSIEAEQAAKTKLKEKGSRSFWRTVPEILKYPFTSDGVWLLLIGTVMYVLLDFAARFSLKIAIIASGYLFAYMQKIIVATANGEEDLPGWPDFSEWWVDIVRPCFMLIWTFAASFGPALVYMIWSITSETDLRMTVLFPLFAWGLLYFPMALLAVAMADSFLAVNPLVVLPTITRLSTQYMLVCGLFFVMVAARFVSEGLFDRFVPWPVVPTVLTAFVSLYFLAVEMRLLGTLYHVNRRKFGWFRH